MALKIAAIASVAFTVPSAAVLVLMAQRVVSFELGLLTLVMFFGMLVGGSVLIAAYRFVEKLK
jgi:hypothetical protein